MTDENIGLERSLAFIEELGIELVFRQIDEVCVLPGLTIEQGKLIVDRDKLKYPGDILHEAGHIAVVPEADRAVLNAADIISRKDREAEEMMAIAWSYAACIYLGIDPAFVFHEEGYRGGADSLIENFNEGRYLALPMLQWTGMAYDENKAKSSGQKPYPHMVRWLRG